MRKIKSVNDALVLFEMNAMTKNECNKSGNYRKGNKAYDNMEKAVKYLLENSAIKSLKIFYGSDDLYVRLCAALYLAPVDNKNCYEIIKAIMKMDEGWASFEAEYVLKDWFKLSDPKEYDRILAN